MVDLLSIFNLVAPFFGLILLGFVIGRWKQLPEEGLAWLQFFLIYVALPPLFYRLIADKPVTELANGRFILATTLSTFLVFMLSLAGIPPLAGFFGKFYVFTSALSGAEKNLGLLWLVIAAIALSAVSLYYYLQVLKKIYVAPALAGATDKPAPLLSQAVIACVAALVLLLGVAPNLLLGPLIKAVQFARL